MTVPRRSATGPAAGDVWRWVVPVVLTLFAGIVMLVRLDEPARIIFDETYYVNDARQYLEHWVEDSFAVHPPVGKWFIALGIAVLGDDPVGWRIVGAIAGAASVWLTYLVGLRLLRHVGYAALAGLLLATDGLFLVQARTSMLDIFLAFFVVLGAWLLLVDRDRTGIGAPPPAVPPPAGTAPDADDGVGTASAPGDATAAGPPLDAGERVPDDPGAEPPAATDPTDPADGARPPAPSARALERPAATAEVLPTGARHRRIPRRGHLVRGLAGVAFGLAVATKWSGLLALGAAGLVVLGWELAHRRRWTGRALADLRPLLASLAVTLVLVPAGVYLASHVPWLVNYEYSHEGRKTCETDGVVREPCDVSLTERLAGLGRSHRAIWNFHRDLEATHPYRAPATTWPVLARPVVYYWETCSEDRANGVPRTDDETGEVTTPEPCVVEREEAAEIVAVGNPVLWWGFLLGSVVLLAGVVRRETAALVVTAFYGAQFVPWLVVSRPVFFFYMVPAVPFLALGLAYAVQVAGRRWRVAGAYVGAVVGAGLGIGGAWLVTSAVGAETRTSWWLALAAGWVVGALVGAGWDRRRPPRPPRWAGWPRGVWLATAVATLAVAAFVYFLPVWTGIPMDDDAVRQRWWFDSWI